MKPFGMKHLVYIGLTGLCVALSAVGSVVGSSLLAWGACILAVVMAALTMLETLKGIS